MPNTLSPGDKFPDIELPDHNGKIRNISGFTAQSEADKRYGFKDGYPLIVIFSRGFFCPRDKQQFRMLREFENELRVNFCRIISISADEPIVSSAYRAGLDVNWTFLSDVDRKVIKQLDILDETEGEYAYRALPYTFVLKPNLEVHKVYNGWYFVGRPTLEELRQDLRSIMEGMDYYSYEAFDSEHVRKIRIPQQTWLDHNDEANDADSLDGVVSSFDIQSGNGFITSESTGEPVFFNFTAIPGSGYRTLKPGDKVTFELVKTHTGLSARNVQKS